MRAATNPAVNSLNSDFRPTLSSDPCPETTVLNRILRLEGEVRQNPEDFDLWCALAEARIAVRQHDGAVDALESAEKCGNADVEHCVRLGSLFQQVGLLDRARRIFVQACRHAPESAQAQERLGLCLVALGDVRAGVTCLASATWLAPEDVAVRAALGRALTRVNRLDEAEAHLREAVRIAPDHPEAACNLADLCRVRGELSEARGVLVPAVEAHPHHRAAAMSLAELWIEEGSPHNAVTVLTNLAAHHSEDAMVLTALGRAERLAEHRASARATLTRAAALPDAPSEPLVERARLERSAGRMTEAVDALREAVSRDPQNLEAHRALGEALHAAGDRDGAMSMLTRAAFIDPEDESVRISLDKVAQDKLAHPSRPPERAASDSSIPPRAKRIALSGDNNQYGMDRLLQILADRRSSGILRVVSPRGAGELHLVDGSVAGASTSTTNRLGELLVEAGLMDDHTLDSVVAEQRATRKPRPLGVLVVERHLLSANQVRPILERQVLAALAEMLGWSDGQFAFDRQAAAALPPALGIEPEHLLEAARAQRDLTSR
jgi:Flp pilus assembly protein TadD